MSERGKSVPLGIQGNKRLDGDTRQYGLEPPFETWEADSTGMVHVLWSARNRGLTLDKDADEIATMIMRSRWLRAVEHFAAPASVGGPA